MEFHPIANCFPLIDGSEFDELVADVKAHGVHEPVIVYEGMILDGRNRYRATQIAGVDCPMVMYDGDDPVGFVVSLNLRRRHLSEGQRAWVAAQIANLSRGRPSEDNPSIEGLSTEAAASMLNVGRASVERAKVVRDHGVPELQQKVAKGEVAPSTAADVARLPEPEQQQIVAKGEKEILEAAKRIRAERAEERRAERVVRIEQISRGNETLVTDRRYPVIYADPPWRYEHSETESRAIENQYPTMSLDEICALPVAEMAADDAILFMWTTAPKLEESFRVLEAWGFRYRSCAVWDKQKIGMGYYFRIQHELLLVATRGEFPTPSPSSRVSSVICEARGEHSAKPERFYEIIEGFYPELSKIELFCRSPRDGWAVWGNQAQAA